jgi:hypothetical protein
VDGAQESIDHRGGRTVWISVFWVYQRGGVSPILDFFRPQPKPKPTRAWEFQGRPAQFQKNKIKWSRWRREGEMAKQEGFNRPEIDEVE